MHDHKIHTIVANALRWTVGTRIAWVYRLRYRRRQCDVGEALVREPDDEKVYIGADVSLNKSNRCARRSIMHID